MGGFGLKTLLGFRAVLVRFFISIYSYENSIRISVLLSRTKLQSPHLRGQFPSNSPREFYLAVAQCNCILAGFPERKLNMVNENHAINGVTAIFHDDWWQLRREMNGWPGGLQP
jgi:hypothetical protein